MKKRILTFLSVAAVMLTLLTAGALSANAALVGDIEGNDGKITSADARIILRVAVSLEKLTEEQLKIADTDANGTITASDARTVLRMSVGLDDIRHYYTKEVSAEADCTSNGVMLFTCTECDDSYTAEIPALGHSFTAPEILVAVTCETDGKEKYTCQREGCTHTEEKTIPAGHTPDIPAATCTEAQTCTRGNHIMTEALGHTTDWGTCSQCKIFITAKHEAAAATVKAKFNEAKTEATTAYSYIQNTVGAASWLTSYAKSAKPYYVKARAAYQAAHDACADIPELAAIKAKLAKNIENTTGIIAQIDVIAGAGFVDSSNYFTLVDPIDNLNYINSDSIIDTDKALTKLIVW